MTTDIAIGTVFKNRREITEAGLHRNLQAGIDWDAHGALAIVLSGGYEEDEDYGSLIIYTGAGGRTGRKWTHDQEMERANKALVLSKLNGQPVKVIRGHEHKSPYSPSEGYQYAGEYLVTDFWEEIGNEGFRIYRYRLEQLHNGYETTQISPAAADIKPERIEYSATRIVRDTKIATQVKEMYNYQCQVCREVLELPLGQRYAEGAHIRGLGRPHDGPDVIENMLCLCPNHHVLFDNYSFSVNPISFEMFGCVEGELYVLAEHKINPAYFEYHNQLLNMGD